MGELKERRAPVRSEEAKQDHPEDFYPTPPWCTRTLAREVVLPEGGRWLEPCAGHGAIVEVLPEVPERWDLVELRHDAYDPLRACVEKLTLWQRRRVRLEVGTNYLTREPPTEAYDLGITNPPSFIAERVVGKMLLECRVVICLLQAGFLGSQARSAFWQTHPADVVYLSERPDFKGDGGSDNRDWAWFVWPTGALKLRRPAGRVVVASAAAAKQRELFR